MLLSIELYKTMKPQHKDTTIAVLFCRFQPTLPADRLFVYENMRRDVIDTSQFQTTIITKDNISELRKALVRHFSGYNFPEKSSCVDYYVDVGRQFLTLFDEFCNILLTSTDA